MVDGILAVISIAIVILFVAGVIIFAVNLVHRNWD